MHLVPTTAIPTDPRSTARTTGHGSPTAAFIVHECGVGVAGVGGLGAGAAGAAGSDLRHVSIAIETRPGFAAMLERIESNGVRTILVETANRFARDLMVQEVGYRPERIRCQPWPAALGFVRRSGDAVSKLDWAGDGAECLEAFTGAKDRHIAIVEHATED